MIQKSRGIDWMHCTTAQTSSKKLSGIWMCFRFCSYSGRILDVSSCRMYPPVPLSLREAVKDDIFLEKYYIPKGTIILMLIGPMMRWEIFFHVKRNAFAHQCQLMHHYSIINHIVSWRKLTFSTMLISTMYFHSRRPELFEDPDTFNPDRFDDPEVTRNLYSFMPFLIGPRMCLGHKFSMAELSTLMVLLLKSLEFELIPDYVCKRRLTITMRPNPPLRLKVTKRL